MQPISEMSEKTMQRIRTRQLGQNRWVDLDILVSHRCSVKAASRIADKVREHVLRRAKHVEDVVVYYYAKPRAHRAGGAAAFSP